MKPTMIMMMMMMIIMIYSGLHIIFRPHICIIKIEMKRGYRRVYFIVG